MVLDEQKEKISEKRLKAKIEHNDKKIEAHLNKADKNVDKAFDDADKAVVKLLDKVEKELEDETKSIEFIVFKAKNILEKILLETQFKMQKTKVELIENLEKDFAKAAELANLAADTDIIQEKIAEVLSDLEEKINSEKEELDKKLDE
ncbi:hypothetical protein [Methanobrevibacter sp.]